MFEAMEWKEWLLIVLGVLLFVSEALPWTAKIKANGIFQAIVNALRWVKEKFSK